jgi:hypothetical protein
MISWIEYDAATRTFRIPLLLPPKERVTFTLTGFRNANGVLAETVKLDYDVSETELSQPEQEKIAAGITDPKLLDLLQTMKEQRSRITSLAERVQTLHLYQEQGLFTRLRACGSTFNWQEPNQYYGDVSEAMLSCSDFRIGCDGRQWWWHLDSSRHTRFVACPTKEMGVLNISFCDPFKLTVKTPSAAAAELRLNYAGLAETRENRARLVEAWKINPFPGTAALGSLIRWAIDPHTYRPAEIAEYSQDVVAWTRFFYDAVNQPLAPSSFAVPEIEGLSPSLPEALDADYTNRFVNVRDGSDGRMSVRWGKEGSKGRSSSGLN